MLRGEDHGPVRYFSLAHTYAGRAILTTGVYFVDGLLIDTGPANAQVEFASIIGGVDAHQVVLTHHHEDHTGNAAFAANHLDRPPLAHHLALPLVRNPAPLPFYRRVVWGTVEPFQAEALGETLRTPNHTFEIIHTPGHAPDHVALYEPDRKWLFAGDLFLAPRLKILRADEDLTGIMASLRKLIELPDCTLFCQHAGARPSHRESLGAKLDFLRALQEKTVALAERGLAPPAIVDELGIDKRGMRLLSRGEFSAANLVGGLLRDAGVDIAGGGTAGAVETPRPSESDR